jgi:hypothetical protein
MIPYAPDHSREQTADRRSSAPSRSAKRSPSAADPNSGEDGQSSKAAWWAGGLVSLVLSF